MRVGTAYCDVGQRPEAPRGKHAGGPAGPARTWEQVGDAQRDQRGRRLALRFLEQRGRHNGGAINRLLRAAGRRARQQ